MITVAEIVGEIISTTPFLEEGLLTGILNLSALARKIKPQIEAKLMKPIETGAIVMALKRLSIKMKKRSNAIGDVLQKSGDITVRSNLVEYTFLNSEAFLEKQKQILHKIATRKGVFLTITQGVFECTIIASQSIEEELEKVFHDEKLLSKFKNLSSITIIMHDEIIFTPGVYYSVLKRLAWENINIIESVTTLTEFTIILEETLVDRAFSTLKSFLRKH